MALMKWSNSSTEDEEEKKDGIIQVKSVQSQWQPTDENQQSQQKTRSEQDYMFSEEKAMRDEQQRQRAEAERQRQLAIAEQQRQNAIYAEQQRQANLANQAQQRQQAQAQPNDDYNRRLNEYVGQKVEQERKAWNDARSWSDKLFGQNSYGDTEERRTKANAIAQFKVDNTDWNNAYQVADTQRYAKSASNISNAISQSYGDYLKRADKASKSVGDLPLLGNLSRLATTGSGSILDRSEANENIINNVGDIKYKTSIGKNGKQYDVEEMINFVNKGLETNSMTYLEAEELLSQVGMDQRFKIGENNTVEERSVADRTADSSKRIISAVGNPLFSVLENTGRVVGDVADNTVGNLASGAIDMTFGNVQRMLGGDPNTDDDPNSFNALNAGDWSRLAKNLPSGMITGVAGAPRKITEGAGQIISGVANADLGHIVGGAARFGDGAIDIGGLRFGGSGRMLKAITGELGEQAAKQTALKIVAQLAKDTGQEGLEEGVQDLLGQIADNNGDLSKIDLSRTLEATKQGAVGGALMGGTGKAISGVRGRFDTNMDTQTQEGFENQLNNLGDQSEEFNSNREIVIPAPQNQLQAPNLPDEADTFTQPKQFEPIAPLEMDNFETILGTEPSEVVSDYQSKEAPQTRELKLIEDIPERTVPAVENNAPSVENTFYTPDTITQLQNQYAGADDFSRSKISGEIQRMRDIMDGRDYSNSLGYDDRSVYHSSWDNRYNPREEASTVQLAGGRNAVDFSDTENKWTGGDGYDRFEIDDSKAEWKIPIDNVSVRKKFKLSDILTHDELYKNYPEFKDMPVSFKKMKLTTGGYYEPATGRITLNSTLNSKTLLRTILHEIQHRIQQKEGFSEGSGVLMSNVDVLARKRGVSPAEARKEVYELLKTRTPLIEEYNTLLRKKKEDLNSGDKYTKQLEELKTAIDQNKQRLKKLGLKKASGFTEAGYDSYKRNAGEVEARAVEKRQAMTAEERAKTPFNESFDVPADDVLWDDVFPYKQQPTNKSKTAEEFLAEPDENFDEDLPIKPKKEKDILDRFISQYDTKEVPFKALINTTLELGLADGVDFNEVIAELKNYPKFLDKQGRIKPGAKKIIDRIVELEKQRAKAQKQVNRLQKNANQSRKGENGSLDLENLKYTTQDQKARNHAIKQKQLIENQMNANVMRLMSKAGLKHAFVNNLNSVIDYRKANMLLSAPSLSRNITQELAGNVANFIDNPINSIKSLPNSFRDGFSGAKRSLEGWKNTDALKASPHKYIMGNTYSTTMAGTQALADARFDGARQTIAEEVAKLVAEENGVKPTKELVEFVKASGGMEMEMVARTMTGVYNASSNRFAADQMMKAYIDFIKNGDEQSHAKFMSIAEKSSTVAQALRKSAFRAKNLSNDGKSASALMNFFAGVMDWLVPFSATATNAVSNTLYELNPFRQSVYDLFKSEAQNSNKAVVGSRIARHFMTSKVAPVVAISGMFASGMAGYNDSDEDRSKPQGFWIKFGDIYTTPRAIGMDVPFAIIGVAHEMSKDISADTVDFSKYGRMIASSVPYINEMKQTNSWLTDLMSDWGDGKLFDPGYQTQTHLISTAKSLTPFANNNLYPAIRAMNGKMTDQKKMYDKDVGKHFQNMLTKSFATSDEQWNSLEDSRDATGRVRSVDLPLGFGKHEITDEQTKRYNQSVMDMNNISKKYKLGNLVGDNWNTYDEGKSNSNFNTLMGMIARTDESGWKNDHNKLIPNDKLRDLSSQIYQSVFEGKGDNLLTMGGEELFSDVKVPNSAGSKNTSLPISMNSIRDTYLMGSLTQEQNDALNAIRTEKDTNYADYSAKKISKDQYLANKDSYATREREILSQSKNYEKWNSFWNDIKETGFFEKDGYGSTKSGQMWLWNALNNMYLKDGDNKTPATNWKDSDSSKSGGYSRRSSGGGNNLGATAKNKHGIEGIENKAKARKMTSIKGKTLTPANIKISLQNKIKKDATRNYKG